VSVSADQGGRPIPGPDGNYNLYMHTTGAAAREYREAAMLTGWAPVDSLEGDLTMVLPVSPAEYEAARARHGGDEEARAALVNEFLDLLLVEAARVRAGGGE
jgi:hypothetical protein